MAQLRALVIGVNEYVNYRPSRPPSPAEDASMPSAAVDAGRIEETLHNNADRLGFSRVTGKTLTGCRETTKEAILKGLHWLAEGATGGDQLVFYFSGHSGWIRHKRLRTHEEKPPLVWYEVALCPSDTLWSKRLITGADVYTAAYDALLNGACLEIILETCAAHGLPGDGLDRSGFGVGSIPNGKYARWDASGPQESSHSGPYPPCTDSELQGLFTRLFCDNLMDQGTRRPRARGDLLDRATRGLKIYQKRFRHCCGKDPFKPEGSQSPSVEPTSVLNLQALASNCAGAERPDHQWEKLHENGLRWVRSEARSY